VDAELKRQLIEMAGPVPVRKTAIAAALRPSIWNSKRALRG
jgi:hypothetical protein